MSWDHHAPFQGQDPELFLPIGTAGPVLRQLINAKRVCTRCPVERECLRWAPGMRRSSQRVWLGVGSGGRR